MHSFLVDMYKLLAAMTILCLNNINLNDLPDHCHETKKQIVTIEYIQESLNYTNPKITKYQESLHDLSNIFECPGQCYLHSEYIASQECNLDSKFKNRLMDYGCSNSTVFSSYKFLAALNGPEISNAIVSFENQNRPFTKRDQKMYDHLKELQKRNEEAIVQK